MPGHRDILPREGFGEGVSAAVVGRDRTIGNFVSGDAAHVWILDTDGLRHENPVRETERILGGLATRPVETKRVLPGGLQHLVP